MNAKVRLVCFTLFGIACLIPAPAKAQNITLVPTITTVAGNGTGGFSGDGSAATAAELQSPDGVAVDAAGNIYISDYNNNRVRKVSPAGVIITFAGNGTAGFSGDGGAATAAELSGPIGLAVDASGNLYIADFGNSRIREVNTSGVISTVAGGGSGGDGGPATAAQLNHAESVAFDSAGNLYISDSSDDRIREVSGGVISTVAGNGTGGFMGDGAAATAAELDQPLGIGFDSLGNLYIVDSLNQRVREVNTSGTIDTFAGDGTQGYNGDDLVAVEAELNNPNGEVVNGAGDVFIADYSNNRVREVSESASEFEPFINTVAGTGTPTYNGDNIAATSANLSGPAAVALDNAGNLYIAEESGQRVRKVSNGTPNFGLVNVGSNTTQAVILVLNNGGTLASVATSGDYAIQSNSCPLNTTLDAGTMCTLQVKFTPSKPGPRNFALIATDNTSTTYNFALEGTGVGAVAAFTPGIISSYAGMGIEAGGGYSGDGGPATSAQIFAPQKAKMDSAGNLYIADTTNNAIRKVNTSQVISTVAGTGPTEGGGPATAGYNGDYQPATSAELNAPNGVAADGAGDFYIADTNNQRIREVNTTGTITTIAGYGGIGYGGDGGSGASASLDNPTDVAVDSNGNVYVADQGNNAIRKIDTNDNVSTVAGTGSNDGGPAPPGYNGDNIPATAAQLNSPTGVAIDSAGNLYIADTGNYRVRKVNTSGIISTVAGDGVQGYSGDGGPAASAELNMPEGVAVDDAGDVYIADALGVVRKVDTFGIITTVAGAALEQFSGDGGPATAAGLDHPAGIFVDNLGNLFISDSRSSVIREVNVAMSVVTFPTTSVGSSSPAQTLAVSDVGNAALSFTSITASTNFAVDSGTTTCTPTGPQQPGTSCNIGVKFAPAASGNPDTGTLTVNDNGANTPQVASLSGNTGGTPPTITSSNGDTFQTGTANSFQVTTSGPGPITITENGALPNGVTFHDNGDGTAFLSGTPAAGSAGSYPITFTASNGVNPAATQMFTLTVQSTGVTTLPVMVTLLGTGTGQVTDDSGAIHCMEASGVMSGTCSANYSEDSTVILTASNEGSASTFAGWGGDCADSGTSPTCTLYLATDPMVTANFISPPTTEQMTFNPGTNVVQTFAFDCPGNPNPITPSNPCTAAQGPNASAFEVSLPAVYTAFTMDVTATEIQGDGLCPAGGSVTDPTDFDCRFKTFFNYGTDPDGNTIVPLCNPYANGNCVHYDIYYCVPQSSGPCVPTPGQEPPATDYLNDVNLKISYNNDAFVPPAPYYTGSLPRFYDDPDYAFTPTSPYGTICGTPMMTSGGTMEPYSCQFEFDVTTFYNPTEPVDATIGGTIRQFNDLVVAFPPTTAGASPTVTPDVAAAPTSVSGNCVNGCTMSSTTATFTIGQGGTFVFSSNGFPVSTLTESGALPAGLTFSSTTGTISGTPAAGTSGSYPIMVTATNSQGHVTQNFTIVVGGGTTSSTLKISPSSLNFGTVDSGGIALASTTLTNTGTTMITFTGFTVKSIPGDDSNGFLGVELCPKTLNPGKSCPIIMSFTADSNTTATHAANLVITDNAAGSPQTIPMSATVINPRASLSSTSLSFGSEKTGKTSAAKTVKLTNSGTTTLKLSGLSISGNFALVPGAGACTSSTQLAPNAYCTINVTFTPTSKGSKTGSVKITDNALSSPQYIQLSGSGT